MTQAEAEVVEPEIFQLQLQSMFLLNCSVRRGERSVDVDNPGRIDAKGSINIWQSDDAVGYEVATTYTFLNGAFQLIAEIEVTFAVNYLKPTDSTYGDDQLEEFGHSVVFQVTPFQREFLASMTNRMALTPFYLPLVRATDISVRSNDEEP